MKKVLILGATGLIGHQVYYYLKASEKYDVMAMAHTRQLDDATIQIDARDEESFIRCIIDISPDMIINCMGILISEANQDPEHAIFLNAYMPHRLKRLADALKAKLIHISTDCVFSGKKGKYIESDCKDANDIYGRAKALGEVTIEPHVTLRTSVMGPELKEGEELFHWFMRQEEGIQGYTQSWWSGVTTLELAKAVEWAIQSDVCGLYHLTNSIPINKYDLLMLLKKYTGHEVDIKAVEGRVTDKSFIDTRQELPYTIPDYETMIATLVKKMKSNPSLYAHYKLKV